MGAASKVGQEAKLWFTRGFGGGSGTSRCIEVAGQVATNAHWQLRAADLRCVCGPCPRAGVCVWCAWGTGAEERKATQEFDGSCEGGVRGWSDEAGRQLMVLLLQNLEEGCRSQAVEASREQRRIACGNPDGVCRRQLSVLLRPTHPRAAVRWGGLF